MPRKWKRAADAPPPEVRVIQLEAGEVGWVLVALDSLMDAAKEQRTKTTLDRLVHAIAGQLGMSPADVAAMRKAAEMTPDQAPEEKP